MTYINMKTKTLSLLAPLFMLSCAFSLSAEKVSVLTISDSLHYYPSTPPESFEADVHQIKENWYLRTYVQMDRDADNRQTVEASDEEIIERLGKIPTVIEMPFNSEVRSYINMYASKKQLVENMLGMSHYYMPIFEEALERHGMPLELRYLPIIESALDPNAVSRAGAAGLWQFMIPTAKGEGLIIDDFVDQRRDPYTATDAAVRYLKKLYTTYNDWSLAIAAYNCGPGNVNKAMRRTDGDGKKDFWSIYPQLPKETRGYVPCFIAACYIMNYYHLHGIAPALVSKPIIADSVHVTRRVRFEQISEVLDIPMEEIQVLNPQYRKNVIPGDIRPYPLVLPSLQIYAYLANEDSIIGHDDENYKRREVVIPGAQYAGNGSDNATEITTITHKVKRGETLSSIAQKYGVSIESIKENNKLKNDRVKRGQKLRIIKQNPSYTASPEAVSDSSTTKVQEKKETQKVDKPKKNNKSKTTTHTVRKGESLWKIANRYGVTVKAIKNANNLKSDNLKAGQKLKIPKK